MSYFVEGRRQIIWKRSQHLHQWKQRQLQFIDNMTIATAKQQKLDGWDASFEINIKDVQKLTIYTAQYIHDHKMVKIRIRYKGRHTYFADNARVAFELFLAVVKNKCIVQHKTDKLVKEQIKGNKLLHFGTEKVIDAFNIFRKSGLIIKDWAKEQLVITNKRFVTYQKLGFGEQANEKGDWHVEIKNVKRASTEFEFYKDNLVLKITYSNGSCLIAVPAAGDQMHRIFNAIAYSHKDDD